MYEAICPNFSGRPFISPSVFNIASAVFCAFSRSLRCAFSSSSGSRGPLDTAFRKASPATGIMRGARAARRASLPSREVGGAFGRASFSGFFALFSSMDSPGSGVPSTRSEPRPMRNDMVGFAAMNAIAKTGAAAVLVMAIMPLGLISLAGSLGGCDRFKKGGAGMDAAAEAAVVAVDTATATATDSASAAPTMMNPSGMRRPMAHGDAGAATVVKLPDGGLAVIPAPIPTPIPSGAAAPTFVMPTALPSNMPTALPSNFPRTLPSTLPSNLPRFQQQPTH